MDIPLLGVSLSQLARGRDARKELIVLIRPTVLPTPEIAALTASAEKNKMPEVRRLEKEIRADETQRLKQANEAEQTESLPAGREAVRTARRTPRQGRDVNSYISKMSARGY